MKSILSNKYFLFVLRLFLGFIFLYAAITKISSPDNFAQSIVNYKLIPFSLSNLVAITLPWIELTTAILLIFGIAVRENSLIINSMLLIFIIAIVISLFRGLDIDCGCFGTSDGAKVGIQKVLENIGLLVAGVILIMNNSILLSLNSEKVKEKTLNQNL